MDYNTQREKITMPEYGRLVQEMAEYATTIADRDARQEYASAIIRVMAMSQTPQNRNVPGFRHKLWDHLAMISGYKLDIDYPFPITKKEAGAKPAHVDYPTNKIKYRHYGHLVEQLLKVIAKMPEGADRDELQRLAEMQMRRDLEVWNKNAANARRIHDDIERYAAED